MIRKLFLLLLPVLLAFGSYAQPIDSSSNAIISNGLRVSLLTCGVGDEIWEQFGHTAVRVTDSLRGTDLVYNYGTFSFGEGFELQFMRGKLLYYVSYYPYNDFQEEYEYLNRSVSEQVLNLPEEKEKAIQDFLVNNARPENRYYKYDFFFDNCATRIRDIFPDALGASFQFVNTLPDDRDVTYRQMMNHYFYKKHFERLGCNILLGSSIDKDMTDTDVMWVPDYLSKGLDGATYEGKQISGEPVTVVPGPGQQPAGTNWPFIIMVVIAALTLIGIYMPGMKVLGDIMGFIVLFVTGLLGFIILVMWFWTDHQGCQNNLNILWALPTNLFLAFMRKRNKDKYAMIGIVLILVSFILHSLGVQELPLLELTPLLLSLILIFGNIIRRNRQLRNGNIQNA